MDVGVSANVGVDLGGDMNTDRRTTQVDAPASDQVMGIEGAKAPAASAGR